MQNEKKIVNYQQGKKILKIPKKGKKKNQAILQSLSPSLSSRVYHCLLEFLRKRTGREKDQLEISISSMIPRWDPYGNADFQPRAQSLSTRLKDFQMAQFAWEDVLAKVGDILVPLGLELHPFQVSKYSEASLTMSWPLVETKSQFFRRPCL